MKAAIFKGPRDIRVEDVERPVAGPGEAILRVRACGICGSDLHTYRHGLFEEGLSAEIDGGRVMGHEFSGEVVEVNGLTDLKQGDRICTVGMGANAEFVKVSEQMLALARPVADHVSYDEAATTEPLATSLHAAKLAKPVDGQTCVVMGAGIIGLGVIQCIRAMAPGAHIISVDVSSKRLEMARQLGAADTINAVDGDTVEAVKALTGSTSLGVIDAEDANVDIVFDCAGAGKNTSGPSVLSQAMDMVSFGGQLVVVAVFEKPIELDMNIAVRKDLRIHGSWAWVPEEFVEAAELIESGKIDRKPLISHTFALADASEAYETQLQADSAIKVVLNP
tara:strand:- start:5759 stop:6766 length:1008 start_codon:yes stop_codon:yes gene_type:complete